MSTTWVFVGLLCGRELALNTGLLVSVSIVLSIHMGQDANAEEDTAPPESTEVVSSPAGVADAKLPETED